jgi:hypothetical protein
MRDYVECLPKWAVVLQPVSLTISIQMVRPRQAFVSARLAVTLTLVRLRARPARLRTMRLRMRLRSARRSSASLRKTR